MLLLTELWGIIWIFIIALWLIYGKRNAVKKTFPGPFQYPLIGSAVQMAYQTRNLKHFQVFENLCKKYGPVVHVKVGSLDFLIVEDYEIAKKVFFSDQIAGRFPGTPIFQNATMKQNCGIFFGHGESWKEIRRFTLRTFHNFGFLEQETLETSLTEEIQEFISNFDKQLNSAHGIVKFCNIFNLSAVNLVWRIMTGKRLSLTNLEMKKFVEISARITGLPSIGVHPVYAFPFLQYFRGLTNYNFIIDELSKMQAFFRGILENRRKQGTFRTVQSDFIDAFLKKIEDEKMNQNTFYTDFQLIETCVDLVLAGSDTTSKALEFIFLYLIKIPEIQTKIQLEIDSIIGKSRVPTPTDRNLMPYTEAVIMESLRFANVVPVIYRATTQNTVLYECYIPKNAAVIINATKIHKDPKLWKDPEIFIPERFLDQNQKIVKDHKLLAFGGGKRICVGYQLARSTIFVFLTSILQRYTLEQSPQHPEPSLEPIQSAIINHPSPYYCFVKSRN